MIVTLFLEGDIANMSPNRLKIHWRERDRRRDDWKLLALSAWNEAGCPVFTTRVRVDFHVYRGRAMDEDNLAGSMALKGIIDSLKGRAFPDDSPRYVQRGTVKQSIDPAFRKKPMVEVRIETVKEDEDALAAGA